MTYDAASEAWADAVKRAGVPPTMMRDLRAKAATDKDAEEGIKGASTLLDHTTEAQTSGLHPAKKGSHNVGCQIARS